jgi:hypothetical protein
LTCIVIDDEMRGLFLAKNNDYSFDPRMSLKNPHKTEPHNREVKG